MDYIAIMLEVPTSVGQIACSNTVYITGHCMPEVTAGGKQVHALSEYVHLYSVG